MTDSVVPRPYRIEAAVGSLVTVVGANGLMFTYNAAMQSLRP